MIKNKTTEPAEESESHEVPLEQPAEKKSTEEEKKPQIPWYPFVQNSSMQEIKNRFSKEVGEIILKYNSISSKYCFLGILDPLRGISNFDLDNIYNALKELNPKHEKEVLLMLYSFGGSIESAYQISKLCKASCKNLFVVSVPRQAKSAATLIAIGADEIHIGTLGQLGPIDPQLGNLPALGVSQALQSIAALSERFPGSSDMFARYLRMALTVEQIGYCERISESATQYAERLLLTKKSLSQKAAGIAKELVHEYKDHGFVIDLEEARQHLGSDWILSDTTEVAMAEEIYNLFDEVSLLLSIFHTKKHLKVVGPIDTGVFIFDKP